MTAHQGKQAAVVSFLLIAFSFCIVPFFIFFSSYEKSARRQPKTLRNYDKRLKTACKR